MCDRGYWEISVGDLGKWKVEEAMKTSVLEA